MASRYVRLGSTSNPEMKAWGAAAMQIKSRLGTTYQAAQATSVGGPTLCGNHAVKGSALPLAASRRSTWTALPGGGDECGQCRERG